MLPLLGRGQGASGFSLVRRPFNSAQPRPNCKTDPKKKRPASRLFGRGGGDGPGASPLSGDESLAASSPLVRRWRSRRSLGFADSCEEMFCRIGCGGSASGTAEVGSGEMSSAAGLGLQVPLMGCVVVSDDGRATPRSKRTENTDSRTVPVRGRIGHQAADLRVDRPKTTSAQ